MRDLLRKSIGVSKLNLEIDPDVTVAVGAASILDWAGGGHRVAAVSRRWRGAATACRLRTKAAP